MSTLAESVGGVFSDIHVSLGSGDLPSIAKHYFDGRGKLIRPRMAILMGEAINGHLGLDSRTDPRLASEQRAIGLAAEMYHTASLMHDDVIDRADKRRGKHSINKY